MTIVNPKENSTIKKSNRLVQARYRLTIWETRVFTRLVSMVKPGDEDFKKYRIYLKDILRDFGLESSNSSYQELRDAANTLLRKEVSIFEETKTGLNETRTHLIVSATTQVESGTGNYIELNFHPKIRPHIDRLREKYTTYEVKNVMHLSSAYSFRIYELLKQYEFRGKWVYELDEFKEMIGATEMIRTAKGKPEVNEAYPLYGNFNQKVLKQAQRHLKQHTDICFTYEPIKLGRKVHKLEFTIFENPRHKKQVNTSTKKKMPTGEGTNVNDELVQRLLDHLAPHVDEVALRRWLKEYTVEQLQQAISYTLNQVKSGKKIANIGGYIHRILGTDFVMKAEEKKRAKKEREQARLAERGQLLAEAKEAYDTVQERAKAKIQEVILGIFDRHPDAKRDAFETTSKRKMSGYNPGRSNEELMNDPTFRAVFIAIIRKRFPDNFTEVKKIEKEASKLRSQISQLS